MKPDPGHLETDELLEQLEKRLKKEYRQAVKETQAKLEDYLRRFEIKDEKWRLMVANGEKTKEEYQKWRTGQIMVGKRWEEMRDALAKDMHNANVIARKAVTDAMPDAYAINHNYATFEVEKAGRVNTSYSLYSRETVQRIVKDQPELLPPPGENMKKRIAAGLDKKWQAGQIQSVTLQSILQGESIPNMSKRIAQTLGESNHASTIRYARTAVTGAQNAGRQDAYRRAENMGVKLKRKWIATLDNRTRHEHRILDGQVRAVDEPFEVEGETIMFPGDPAAAGHLIWNCRCTLGAAVDGWESKIAGLRSDSAIGGQSYDEWKQGHSVSERITKQEEVGEAKRRKTIKELYDRKDEAPVKTRKEAYQAILDMGFSEVGKGIEYVDDDIVIDVANQLKTLNIKFGAIGEGHAGHLSAGKLGRNVSAKTVGGPFDPKQQSIELSFDEYAKGKEHLVKITEDSILSNWSMPAAKEYYSVYTLTHEYGHVLENFIIRERMDFDDFEKKRQEAGLDIKKLKKLRESVVDKQSKEIFREILAIAKEDNPNFSLRDNISQYGRTTYQEAFAETFANSQCGKPNELGKAMIKWLKGRGYK